MLTPEAERLWEWLRQQPGLAGFVLIGGSALSLRIHHRLSEDLDFVCLAEKLPTQRLGTFPTAAESAGIRLRADDDEAAMIEFADGGLQLHDYQQNFIAGENLRLSFFAADPPLIKALGKAIATTGPRLAELPELFRAKCLVCAKRSKTRDWFDLFVLIRDHGFTLADMQQTFNDAGIPDQMDIALSRLCSGTQPAHDEGFSHLLDDPPSLETVARFFREQRDDFERTSARTRAQQAKAEQ